MAIFSYFQSIKFIYSLVAYNKKLTNSLIIKNTHYDGLHGENPPVTIMYPTLSNGRVIILYPGASPYAEKHPQIIMLGHVFAHNGFTVYLPRIPPLKILDITERNVPWFIQFYNWLLNVKKINSRLITTLGISYGGGMLLKSLLTMKEQCQLPDNIMTYGTYANAETAIKFLLSGDIRYENKLYKIVPHEWGLIIIFHNFLKNLDLPWDTTGIEQVLHMQIIENYNQRDHLICKLPNYQKNIVQSIISGEVTLKVKELVQEIIINEQDTFRALSPKYWCNKIHNKIFVIHGAHDSMVPFTESVKLAECLPNAELLITYLYAHKELSINKGIFFNLVEIIRLINFYKNFFNHHAN